MSDLDALEAKITAAKQEVIHLATGKRKWTMCIPVQAQDSDVLLMDALNDGLALCARVRVAERVVKAADQVRKHQKHFSMQPRTTNEASFLRDLDDALAASGGVA